MGKHHTSFPVYLEFLLIINLLFKYFEVLLNVKLYFIKRLFATLNNHLLNAHHK